MMSATNASILASMAASSPTVRQPLPDSSLAHAEAYCASGLALAPTCDPCASSVCAHDPYCCSGAWDETCVGEVSSICGQSCAPSTRTDGAVEGACGHSFCSAGSPLESACDPCVTALCALDPYCCGVQWDETCVGELGSVCKEKCT